LAREAEEKYLEWLERMEIPIEETATIKEFQDYLREEFGITEPARIDALWGATDRHFSLAEAGIRAVRIEYPWGVQIRYGVQGMPGLWGWEAVRTIMTEEGYWE